MHLMVMPGGKIEMEITLHTGMATKIKTKKDVNVTIQIPVSISKVLTYIATAILNKKMSLMLVCSLHTRSFQ